MWGRRRRQWHLRRRRHARSELGRMRWLIERCCPPSRVQRQLTVDQVAQRVATQALMPLQSLLLLRHPPPPPARQRAVLQHVPKPSRHAAPLTLRPRRRLNALPPTREGRSQLAAHEVRQTLAQQPHRRSALRRPRRPRVPARRQIAVGQVIQRTAQALPPPYRLHAGAAPSVQRGPRTPATAPPPRCRADGRLRPPVAPIAPRAHQRAPPTGVTDGGRRRGALSRDFECVQPPTKAGDASPSQRKVEQHAES